MMEAKMNEEFAQALEEVDWQSYQDNVLAALKEALEKYRTLYAVRGVHLISQIALWTDPYQHISAVSFETQVHSRKMIEVGNRYMREHNLEVQDPDDLQSNPADFKYERFHTFQHLELDALPEFNLNDAQQDEVLSLQIQEIVDDLLLHIEANLLVVVERVQQLQLLREEPTEDEVWIGVNSPLDWYDDVVKMTVRTR